MKKWIGVGVVVLAIAYTAHWWSEEEQAEKIVQARLAEWKEGAAGAFSYEKLGKGGFPFYYKVSAEGVSFSEEGRALLTVDGPLAISSPVFGRRVSLSTGGDVTLTIEGEKPWIVHGKKEGVLVADWEGASFLSPAFIQLFESADWLPNFRSFSMAIGETAIHHEGEEGSIGPSKFLFKLEPAGEAGRHAVLDLDVRDVRFEGEVKEPTSYTFQSWVEEFAAPPILRIAPLSFKCRADSTISDWEEAWNVFQTHAIPEELLWDLRIHEWESENRFQEQNLTGNLHLDFDEQSQKLSMEMEGHHQMKKALYDYWMSMLQFMKEHPDKITTTTPFEENFKKAVGNMWPLVVDSIPKFHEWSSNYSHVKFDLEHRMAQDNTWSFVLEDCTCHVGPLHFILKGHAEEGLGVYLVNFTFELKNYKTVIRSFVEEYSRIMKFLIAVDPDLAHYPRLKEGAADTLIQFLTELSDKPGDDFAITVEHNEKNQWKVGRFSEEEIVEKVKKLDLINE